MKICFFTSECVPFVKTGGLADVSGALPSELSGLGCEVNVFLPLYGAIDKDFFSLKIHPEFENTQIKFSGKSETYSLYTVNLNNINYYLIDSEKYFHRGSVYTNDPDEDERYIFFQHSSLNVLQKLRYKSDIFHINDWQCALIPELIKTYYSYEEIFNNIKVLFTIHNIAYQGQFSRDSLIKAGLSPAKFFGGGPYEHYGNFNFMKLGIISSDYINTVSPTYAKEILTVEHGSGMEGVLQTRKNVISGILNGIDTKIWSPENDKEVDENYTYESLEKKSLNKLYLQETAGLTQNLETPLIGIVSRLAWQKGFELFQPFIDDIMRMDIQFVILGDGEYKYVEFFKHLQIRFPDKLYFYNGYNNKLAHRITAGTDIFLMPSRYEPCGLNQMYSLNYGTIPVVRKTGGLADTVTDVEDFPETGNGFAFEHFNSSGLYNKIIKALNLFKNKKLMKKVQKRGMTADFSWKKSATQYIELYNKMINE